jgi:hypothetical protein
MNSSLLIKLYYSSAFKGSLKYFFGVPPLAAYIFFLFQLLNEPGLGAVIYPGMALTPFKSSIR